MNRAVPPPCNFIARAINLRASEAAGHPAMVTLTDSQIAAITNATRPLQPCERTEFLAALFGELLNARDEIGDGTIGRLIREMQHRYFRPPTDETVRMTGTRHQIRARA